jgi:glycosyltransferase involved in cell wall biosynthesis
MEVRPLSSPYANRVTHLRRRAARRRGGAAVESFIEETIDQLRAIVSHYEIILVDDGTTDDSRDRVKTLLARYDFVRLLRLSRHFGEETAIAAGLDAAIGD